MILLPCPWCGPRNAQEFAYVGETVPRPDVASASPEQWRDYLHFRDNPRGWTTEQWYHRAGCRRFLVAERHTETNEVRRTWRPQPQAAQSDDGASSAEGASAADGEAGSTPDEGGP